ncbi:hypothetical protein DFH06DRAFT_1132738 [Mycena polygramma]|nr:hypothetical protein DFH06DRAFT_1132729 [Mycena polygramma]KAJ7655634.1 hypothetical protein DFH06DRAFT_1412372 [Mycena polygramma]KAJ7655638.1 hypothetical protein DFH06DRAFT_1132735 [Mycena polygramma]KAJ7655642.1 hypothetical protein DFH06DRAFT_1132738 [Mycena polygramma]
MAQPTVPGDQTNSPPSVPPPPSPLPRTSLAGNLRIFRKHDVSSSRKRLNALSKKSRRQAHVVHKKKSRRQAHVTDKCSPPRPPRIPGRFVVPGRRKSRRQASVAHTWNAPGPAPVVYLLTTTEAPRSGADNAEAMYRLPASWVNPSAHVAPTFIAPCPPSIPVQHRGPCIMEAPRSGAGIVDTMYRRPASAVKPFGLKGRRQARCVLSNQLLRALCTPTPSTRSYFKLTPPHHSHHSLRNSLLKRGILFNIHRSIKSKFDISPSREPRLRGASPTTQILCSPSSPSRMFCLQNFDSDFDLPATVPTYLRRRRRVTLIVAHHRPPPPMLDHFQLSGPCFSHELLLTVTHHSHSPPYLPPLRHEETPLLQFKKALNVPFQRYLGHLGHAQFGAPPPSPRRPTPFFSFPTSHLPTPLISTAAYLRERRDYGRARQFISQRSGDQVTTTHAD